MSEKGRFRKKKLQVWVTEDELQYARDKAKYCNLSMSEYLRKQILQGYVIKYNRFDMKSLANELNKIGVNINQIARHINERGGQFDREDMENLIKEFQNMELEVYAAIWGLPNHSVVQ